MISLFTEIEEKDILDGDCVKIDFQKERKSIAKSTYGQLKWISEKIEHAYVKGGKFISVINNDQLSINVPDYRVKIFLHKYKFISLPDCWYIEGTECFPDIQNYGSHDEDWKTNGASLFQGLTDMKNFNYSKGDSKGDTAWDGESCSFDEFEITERKSQTRHRKLNRLSLFLLIVKYFQRHIF